MSAELPTADVRVSEHSTDVRDSGHRGLYMFSDGVEWVRRDYAEAAKVAALEQITALQRDRDYWRGVATIEIRKNQRSGT
jgi:hypothetical protein